MTNNKFNQTEAYMNIGQKEGNSMLATQTMQMKRISSIQQLQLMVDERNAQDIQQLNMILHQIFTYPSTELAQIHKLSNRMGQYDIRKQNEDMKSIKTQQQDQMSQKAIYCQCCGFIKQQSQVKVCTKLNNINNIGISTYLYFQTLKNLSILLIIAFIVYGIYALLTNIISSLSTNANLSIIQNIRQNYSPSDVLAISISPKEKYKTTTDNTFLIIQCWVGLAMIIVWLIAIILIKYFQKKDEARVEEQTISASDFSVVVQMMPTQLTQKQIQQQLNQYFQTIENIPQNLRKPFTIKKYNVGKPFYLSQADLSDDQVEQITKQSKDMLQMFQEWIMQRKDSKTFSTTKQFRQEQYKKYDQLCKRKQKKVTEILQKVKDQFKKQNFKETTTVFITFQTNHARALITSQNSNQISDVIRYYISCCRSENHFQPRTKDGQSYNVRISRAPQPEDIIWENLGVSDFTIYTRKLITYVVTLILLGASFGAVYGLSKAQYDAQQAAASSGNTGTDYLSILISVVISLINVILGQVIRRLSIFQRDYTETYHQTSLAIKSVAAQLINSIIVPIMANWFIKGNNLYDNNGLADDIFLLGITNAFITPILKIFQPFYFVTRILFWWFSRPSNKIWQNQNQLNIKAELIFFEVGYEYIYIVNLFLFTCFYMSLQPIVIVFSLCGYLIMYWVQKWTLFNRMKRPVPGTNLINVAMGQLILLGGIMYALGSLCWCNIFPGAIPTDGLIPNLIAIGFGVFLFIFPFSAINKCCFSDDDTKQLKYDEHRIYLPSEYDRLNPSTSAEGLKDYMNYIEKFKDKMKNATKEQQQQIAKMFVAQGKRGAKRVSQMGIGIGGGGFGFGNNAFFGQPQQPIFNPMMLGAQLMPNKVHVPQNNPMMMMMMQKSPQNSGMNSQPKPPQMNMIPQMNIQPQMNMQPQMNVQPMIQQQNNFGFNVQQAPPRFGFQQQNPQPFGFGFNQPQQMFGQPQMQMNFGGIGFGGMGFGFR